MFESNGTDNIYYTYDSNDSLVSMELNGVEYYYIRNIQGDIIGLIDNSGDQVVSYTYDTWGRLLSIDGSLKDSLGIKNPYRYRGYRYDNETELYYLQSRYYNPEWGRFLNADSVVGETGELLSHNMFAYCANDPVNNEDPDGFSRVKILIKGGKKLWPIAKKQIPRVYKAVKNNIKKSAGKAKKTYQTYTKTNKTTGQVYSGRTSGTGSPAANVAKRDANHHMNKKGFGPSKLDRSSTDRNAIRGREQQLIDIYGGAKSQGGTSGNAINRIGPNNKNIDIYLNASRKEFGR